MPAAARFLAGEQQPALANPRSRAGLPANRNNAPARGKTQ